MAPMQIFGAGLNWAAANIIVGGTFNKLLNGMTCDVPKFMKDKAMSVVRCGATGGSIISDINKVDAAMSNIAVLDSALVTYMDSNSQILPQEMMGMKSLIKWVMVPNVTTVKPAPAICTIEVPNPYPASGAVKTGIAVSIMLAAAAWFQ
jgi:hypothetical protein